MDRRNFIKTTAVAGIAASVLGNCSNLEKKYQNGKSRWPLCLNTSTIRPASLEKKIEIAAKAGFDGIELWIDDLENYEKKGGNLKELGQQIKNKGLYIPNIIGLWDCMPMDNQAFTNSLPRTRERMRAAAEVGSKHIAAIPVPDRADFDIKKGIQRYRELLKIGRDEYGIITAFEFVGFFKGIHRLGQAAAIALDVNDKDACLIMDTFHLFRGGSGFNGVRHLNGSFIADFHWNDVPSQPDREEQRDKHRLFPGDGILPLVPLLKDLKAINYTGPLSLELFNREHWESDLQNVAIMGLQKMMRGIEKADQT